MRCSLKQEYLASLIGLCKNNGALSCVGIDFHLIRSRKAQEAHLSVIIDRLWKAGLLLEYHRKYPHVYMSS